ncbi:serine hydrolase domain-containing protein [Marivirga tractuosa]|uniref:serine hydrolase domain-containing protein n=1 Tax=Marivirga tractuosa TaxID=1006 RepID=UPI0035D0053D
MRLLTIILFILTTIPAFGQVEKISKIIDEIDAKENLNGVLLVGQYGEIIFQKAYGMANQAFDVPNTIDTKFLIGSLTKQFTAILVMQEVEKGNLNLDYQISNYLPDFRKETGNKVTVRHLLTHTHGIPNADLTSRYKAMTKEEFIKKYCETNLEFQPGTQFKYSDIVGYFLLGAILEKVTGKEFDELLKKNILDPLNMQNTAYYSQEIIQPNLAVGYLQKDSGFFNAPYWHISQSFSAAGMFSTVTDLFKWDSALKGAKLISNESLKAVFTPFSDKIRYGCGWFINDPEINGEKRLFAGHNGGASGYKSQIMRGINEELVVIYLSNSNKYVELRYPVIEALMIEKN